MEAQKKMGWSRTMQACNPAKPSKIINWIKKVKKRGILEDW
jgi:hypothetical protein